MFCAVLVTEQCQGLILMLLGIGLNTHMHSVFPTGKTAQNLLVQGKVRKRLRTRSSKQFPKNWSVRDLAQSVVNSGRCSAGLLNKAEQFNWNHRLKSHFCQMSAWCVVNPVFWWRLHLENSTVSALVEQVKPPVAETESSLQPVPLLWWLSAHSSASCSAQSTQSKVGVMQCP